MDDGDQDGHAQIGVYEHACRLVALIEVGGPAEPEIDRHEHQSRAMRDRHREGPEPSWFGGIGASVRGWRRREAAPRASPPDGRQIAAIAPQPGPENSSPSARRKRLADPQVNHRADWCSRHSALLTRTASGPTIYGRGRNIEEIETALSFDRTTGLWQTLCNATEVRRSDERSKIIEVLRKSPDSLGPKDIAAAGGLKEGSVRHLVRKMVEKGEIELDGRGAYRLSILNSVTDSHRSHVHFLASGRERLCEYVNDVNSE